MPTPTLTPTSSHRALALALTLTLHLILGNPRLATSGARQARGDGTQGRLVAEVGLCEALIAWNSLHPLSHSPPLPSLHLVDGFNDP